MPLTLPTPPALSTTWLVPYVVPRGFLKPSTLKLMCSVVRTAITVYSDPQSITEHEVYSSDYFDDRHDNWFDNAPI